MLQNIKMETGLTRCIKINIWTEINPLKHDIYYGNIKKWVPISEMAQIISSIKINEVGSKVQKNSNFKD
jgi:hypothetical protein